MPDDAELCRLREENVRLRRVVDAVVKDRRAKLTFLETYVSATPEERREHGRSMKRAADALAEALSPVEDWRCVF